MPIGGSNQYPTAETVTTLFRSLINDDGSGADGAPQSGQIATDDAPFMLPFLNAGIRWLYSKLRLVNSQALILDNYIVSNVPPVNPDLSPPNPGVQTALQTGGYYDGIQIWPDIALPATFLNVIKVRERLAGTNNPFVPLQVMPDGLPATYQVENFGYYEQRQDGIWFPGSLTARDLNIRCTIQAVPLTGPALDLSNTFIPIYDCERVVVGEMLTLYAMRFSPIQYQAAKDYRDEALNDIRGEIIYANQGKENARADWAGSDSFFPWGTQL